MPRNFLRLTVSRRPGWIVGGWLILALAVGLLAPDLTRLAAEGQAKMLGRDAESVRAAEVIERAWPEQSYTALAVAALHRPEGLTEADRAFARRLARRFGAEGHPAEVLRVLGPDAAAEIAERLASKDGTVQLVAIPLSTSFVSPATKTVVDWLRKTATTLDAPAGLRLSWTGDAVIGRDYMASVQTSLDRVAVTTVVLLLLVLLAVYRSFLLAVVPLVTIGVSLAISRGVLAWMSRSGWEISPLVELFLVAILFGSGTDFCLFISWRFAEQFHGRRPGRAMRMTLRRALEPLLTSAGTVIVGLSLMGTTRFKLFSSTGPSVAIGLALTLAATLTLTPALLVLLAKYRPRAFDGLSGASGGFWDRIARAAMSRPLLSWAAAVAVMVPLAGLGLRTHIVQDVMTEMPARTASTQGLRLLVSKFDPGMLAPLSVVLESDDGDFRSSEGLALIDDVSRFLVRQRRLVEVRSATQPLGRTDPVEPARIGARLAQVNEGFGRMAEGASQLRRGLGEGAAKLQAALWLERRIGLRLTGPARPRGGDARTLGTWPAGGPTEGDPRETMLRELGRAAEGAGQIADGAIRARREMASILRDPVGRRALSRLLIDAETVRDHPELNRSFEAYITPDGHRARIDLTQADRMFSAAAMDQVQTLRRRLNDYLGEVEEFRVRATLTGPNAESADIRALTRSDQLQSWFVVPLGVFLVLICTLRDPMACLNLVATMVLTYAFALGSTHLVFVNLLGAPGLDWKVPYFLFVLLVAVGVDYNVFLMSRLREEADAAGLRRGIVRAIARTGGLISSAAAITACSFAAFLVSPLGSLRQLGFALVVGIAVDAVLVRPLLVPCGHWLLNRRREGGPAEVAAPRPAPQPSPSKYLPILATVVD